MLTTDDLVAAPFHKYWDNVNVDLIEPDCWVQKGVLWLPEGLDSKLKCKWITAVGTAKPYFKITGRSA